MICTANWVPMAELSPPLCKTVMLYADGDLYPVIGFRNRGVMTKGEREADFYMLEEGGPEDGEHRKYPILKHYRPTHWCELPQVPYETLEGR